MKTTLNHPGESQDIESYFSLHPLLDQWQKCQLLAGHGAALSDSIASQLGALESSPADPELITLIRRVITESRIPALTPAHAENQQEQICQPFQPIIGIDEAGNLVPETFSNNGINETVVLTESCIKELHTTYFDLAYQVILRDLYGMRAPFVKPLVFKSRNLNSLISAYTELYFDDSFIRAEPVHLRPAIDMTALEEFAIHGCIDKLRHLLPALEAFRSSGIMPVSTRNVTHREITGRCRKLMLSNDHFPCKNSFETLATEIKDLTGIADLQIGLIFKEAICPSGKDSLGPLPESIQLMLATKLRSDESRSMLEACFNNRPEMLISSSSESVYDRLPINIQPEEFGISGLLLYPIRMHGQLLGMFAICSSSPNHLGRQHINLLEPMVAMLNIALERAVERRDSKVDQIIKEQFTAVQSSVDWKFKEIALNHLRSGEAARDKKIERVVFENVYPLYGSIDIRNSSIERMQAIQQDLLRQLIMAVNLVTKGSETCFLPLLGEIKFRLQKYIDSVSIMLFPGDEVTIQQFLEENVCRILKHIAVLNPRMASDVDRFFELMSSGSNRQMTNYGEFEKSINTINSELSRFLDEEQAKIQELYPHYFERFVTDGIDFNIYIGQSIAPTKPFEQFHLQNLKLWQLTTLVAAAKLTYRLAKELPLPLHTTQLILAHTNPINISFRPAERKFDVDGAYNIHYEIIKKRIDKVRIRNTNERLTQPGTIAIVYSQASEASEYAGYLEYLERSGLVCGEVERLELEELRGVVGLKALRVRIVLETANEIIAAAFKGDSINSDTETTNHNL